MSASLTQTPCAPMVVGAQQADRIEKRRRRHLVLLARDPNFVLRLGEVNHDGHAVFARELRGRRERRLVVRVERVRRDGRHDETVVLELLDEALGAGQAFGRRFGVGDRELNDRLAQHAAQPGLDRRLRDLFLEVVHVDECRRARLDHLDGRQPRADADELGRDRLRLRGKDVFLQPVHQREVVGQPAVHHHRRVGVGVDEAREDDLIARVDRLGGLILRRDRRRRIDVDDVGAVDGESAGRKNPMRGVLRDHGPAADDQRHPPPGRLRRDDDQRRHGHAPPRAHCFIAADCIPPSHPACHDHVPLAISHQPCRCIVPLCRFTSSTIRSCTTRSSHCATRPRLPNTSAARPLESACC